ncbi:hypothetical protein JAK51_16950 [Stenotrophomonas maltophilia]|uniref:hypothetical protein n=1 Tax=Stenotrophomonas maltophilia TaxID=40324 RepID=UPI0021CA9732|nr:hypothetical protein [Stenotrophomonas maltophilia]MCU1127905.1 hypothetical protein [Stenotrophomonas maltophilia]
MGMPVPRHIVLDGEPSTAFNPDLAGSVGFAWDDTNSLEYQPPAIFVLHNENLKETLSWLRVYARDSFPLSQFGRVVTMDDWRLLAEDDSAGHSFRDDRWASVVLGELLAQSEPDAPLDTLPTSRAQACFSTAVARTQKLYDSYKASRVCTDRLRVIESDPRFLRRSVSVESLVPAWSMASTSFGKVSSSSELAEFILSAADSYENLSNASSIGRRITLHPGLFSDSIEERVVAFQQITSEATNHAGSQGHIATHTAAAVAAAAFMVGRGTSHAFLIKKCGRLAPLAHIWFGVMAGIAGPSYWDPSWAKSLKGIEKHIRASFCWSDPPMADISWAEYEWVSNAVRGHQAFSGISRQVNTSISIEVFPGASCQMRLQPTDSKTQQKVAPQAAPIPNKEISDKLSSELASAIEQIVRASVKAKELLSANIQPSSTANQHSNDLFEGPRTKKVAKKSKLK